MTVALLVLHAVSAMLLLGAITHQAFALWWPGPRSRPGWWPALRAVQQERYAPATIVLYGATVLLGAINYPPFRAVARVEFLDASAPWATGLFEVKEHAAAIGLALLPAYWAVWRRAEGTASRRAVTTVLTVLVWWNFVVGHIVNNARGLP